MSEPEKIYCPECHACLFLNDDWDWESGQCLGMWWECPNTDCGYRQAISLRPATSTLTLHENDQTQTHPSDETHPAG
jgi:hypothetical protein